MRRGIWQPPDPAPVEEPRHEPTFHEFASEWLEARRHEWVSARSRTTPGRCPWTYTGSSPYRVSAITIEDVDRYRSAKVREGRLGARSINKTISYLSTILEVAVEYGYIDPTRRGEGAVASRLMHRAGSSSKPIRCGRCSTRQGDTARCSLRRSWRAATGVRGRRSALV